MSMNRRIFSGLVIAFVLLPFPALPVASASSLTQSSAVVFTAINFVPNIETIGVAVSGTGLPQTAELSYRLSGETAWHPGHRLVLIPDGRLIGSLFNLSAATYYDVKVTAGASEITGSVSTQLDQFPFTPSVILYVDDNAPPGGNGAPGAPYQKIQEAVNHAVPGTEVSVADGVYREAVTFPQSGAAGNWIQVKAAGNAAILDSADILSGNIWTLTSTAKVWFAKVTGPVAYLARSGSRFYQYDDLNGLKQARGHGGVTVSEGWFYEAGTGRLYIRSLDTPSSHLWQLPRLNHAFDVGARNWLWIEGFEIRYYGTTTNGCGVCTLNASHIVIRRNKIHNMQLGIFFFWNGTADQGNDVRIESNDVSDPGLYGFPWAALKGSYMEGSGIIVRGRFGAIVRDNTVHGNFNGIYVGSSGALENPDLAFDADIYNNHMYNISDDGLEPEGACINQRFRDNVVDKSFIGISIAPVTQGPTWVLRNVFTNLNGRIIKFADSSDGMVFIYHNTGWTTASNINGADLITSIHHVTMRNNIFQTAAYSIYEVPTGSTANDWNNDNWYTTRGATGPHFKWENVNYNTVSALCAASGLECNGYENPPGFTNPAGGNFTLLSTSPNIDRGINIPGINDHFAGNAPDVGAYESTFNSAPIVLSSLRANADPTNADTVGFTVTFSESVTGVDISDFSLTVTGVTGASIQGVNGSGTTFTVTVNTGSGNGLIRLDITDNDTITDASNNPLGGAGAGNGNYVSGESYTLIKVFDKDTVGVFRPSNGVIYLKNFNVTGIADVALNYGIGGDYPVTGDWNGDGIDTIGVYRGNTFYLRNSNTVGYADVTFNFGSAGDQPIAGDWDGDGTDTIGVYDSSTFTFYLRNSNTAGPPDMVFSLGIPGDIGIAGDWTGKGYDTVGVFRPSNGVIYLKNTNQTGYADIVLNYGIAGDKPITGDWNNDGIDTIGVLRGNVFYLRNSNTIGFADLTFALGINGDMPIAGNWDGKP